MLPYSTGRDFTEEELLIVHQAVRTAVERVSRTQTRPPKDVIGELYTRLRQELGPILATPAWKLGTTHRDRRRRGDLNLFDGQLKHFRYQRRWQFIERLAEEMMKERGDDVQDILSRCRMLISGMNSSIHEMESLNARSDEVMQRVAGIQQLMEPAEEADR